MNLITAAIILILFLLSLFLLFKFLKIQLYLRAKSAGLKSVGLFTPLSLSSRGVSAEVVINSAIKLNKANIQVSLENLEAAFLTGADLKEVTEKLLCSNRAGNKLSFNEAMTQVLKDS